MHADALLIRAEMAWQSVVERHPDAVVDARDGEAGRADEDDGGEPGASGCAEPTNPSRGGGRAGRVSRTDPDAGPATSGRDRRMEPSCEQHGAVDDACGVILDVEVTTGEVNEGQVALDRPDAVARTRSPGRGRLDAVVAITAVAVVMADAGHAHAEVLAGLQDREGEP